MNTRGIYLRNSFLGHNTTERLAETALFFLFSLAIKDLTGIKQAHRVVTNSQLLFGEDVTFVHNANINKGMTASKEFVDENYS
jgi:hypothetical protein